MSSAPQVPEKARAAVLRERGAPYEIVNDWPVQKPQPGQVLVKISTTGCCHSDCMAWNSKYPFPGSLPLVGGHEGIGKVVSLGEGVTSLPIGTRVGIRWDAYACGKCEPCVLGHETACKQNKFHGYFQPGTFQEYVAAHSEFVIPIPDEIDDVQAAPMMCAGITIYKAMKNANPLGGQWLAVPGAGGGLGHLCVQLGKAWGLRVVGIDSGDKEKLVRKCGAEAFIDFTQTKDVVEEVMKITDGGAHVTIVTTNVPQAYTQAVNYARVFGKLVCVSLTMFQSATAPICSKKLQIIGSATGTRQDAREMLVFVSKGLMKAEIEERKLEDVERTLQDLDSNKIQGRVVFRVAES